VDVTSGEAGVSISRNESDSVLKLHGSLQLDQARQLHEAALQLAASGGAVVIDCAEAAHLDGCAVQVLLALKLALERAGGSIRMTGIAPEVSQYLVWAGVAEHFGVAGPAEAVAQAPRKRRRAPRKRAV